MASERPPSQQVVDVDPVTGVSTADGKALKVTLTAGPCSDGMSDREYPLKAKVELGDEKYIGCAATVAQLGQPAPGE